MTDAHDLLVLGTLYTLDPARPRADAMLARGGRIVRLGSAAACRAEARAGARVVDLGAGSAVPGLVDAHGHVLLEARALEDVALGTARDASECVALAAARARSLPAGAWVRGHGWDESRWSDPGLPDLGELSRAVPDRPVLLERVDRHASWVNARALELAGIGAATPDPPGGRIVRDAGGRPTGVLVDAAQELVQALLPRPGAAELERLLRTALQRLARLGLTAVHDAGCTSSVLRAYARLAQSDALPIRVYAMVDGQQADGPLAAELARWSARPVLGRLEVRAVKLFADGALGSRGAALLDDYADAPGERGLFVTPPDELRRRVRRVVRAGMQPAVHAIGDRACREVIACFAEIATNGEVRRLRPRVEHLQVVRPEDLARLAAAGGVASMQPTHATGDARWTAARLGAGTPAARGAYAWRQVLSAGVPLAFGSDFPVESADPRLGLHAAETRRARDGIEAAGPEERLTREEALRAYTSGAAYAAFADDRRGVLREGLEADLTAFEADVLAVPAEELLDVGVVATVVGGQLAFGTIAGEA